ncbi:MAG: arsenate reductase ArsC [Chloroflexota bacterium]|nr:arsenate reductase ArsC [Chloroflexota bacterium]
MAEGLLRAWAGDRYDAYSAGSHPSEVRPEAVGVMDEVGIDLAGHESKPVDRFAGEQFDWVITVCDDAREACPNFPGGRRTLHWSFEDPAAVTGSDDERTAAFRRARDMIGNRIRAWLAEEPATAT